MCSPVFGFDELKEMYPSETYSWSNISIVTSNHSAHEAYLLKDGFIFKR